MLRRIGLCALLIASHACGGDDQETLPSVNCPDSMPAEDDACDETYATCTYMDCATFGVATATCRTDALWDVTETACTDFECVGETCGAGQICVVSASGYPQGSCVDNRCGAGPIGCGCPGCPNSANGCTSQGIGIECNTCNAEICP